MSTGSRGLLRYRNTDNLCKVSFEGAAEDAITVESVPIAFVALGAVHGHVTRRLERGCSGSVSVSGSVRFHSALL